MRDPLHQVPVRYKLPLMFVSVCLLAFGVGGYLVSGSARQALEGEISARLEFQSRAYATALEGRLQTLARRTEDFASDGYIRDHTESLLRLSASQGGLRVREELRAHLIENKLPLEPAFEDLCLVSADGRVLLATGDSPPTDFLEDVAAGNAAEPSSFSGFLAGDGEHGARIFISTPVFSRRGERILGRLVSWVYPAVWITSAMKASGIAGDEHGDPVRLQLVDSARRHLVVDPALIAANGPGIGSELLRSNYGLELADSERASQLVNSGGHVGYGVIATSYPVGKSGWSLKVTLVPNSAFAAVSGLQSRFLGFGIVLALLASALLFFPMRFLAGPLLRLSDAARRLRDGDFSTRVAIESSDEIGELGGSFNSMADAVQERTERLQKTAEDLRDRQRELSAERDQMRAVISSMRDGLVVLDADGTPVVHNRAAAPILRQILDLNMELRPHHVCDMRERKLQDCRGCLFDPDGVPRSCVLEASGGVYEVHATRLAPDKDGRSGRVLVSRDLSDRITQDERQIHQERLAVLGEVAAVMAHELNNPLAAINMYNQMTADEVEADSEVAANSLVIQRNVQSCKRAIRELLDYSTDTTPEIVAVDIAATLEDVSIFLRPIRERSNVNLRVSADEGLHAVMGDEVQIRQIFVNLIVNALQAIGERGGTINVVAREADGHIFVDVSDDGPGIDEDVREQIFRPFFTTKARGDGTGLGLPTSRRIAEMYGGGLELLSSGSSGTRFRVRLGLAPEPVA